jgi:hypothetical protein
MINVKAGGLTIQKNELLDVATLTHKKSSVLGTVDIV